MEELRITADTGVPLLTDHVYDRVFHAIVSGDIPGGTKLVAAGLAKQLGVSITPVREALLRLANEGLVKPIPRVGYIVELMSDADVADLFDARIGIERLISGLAVRNITSAEICVLENNLSEMNEVLRYDQIDKMIELDRAFHELIAQASRNKTLCSVIQLMIKRTCRYRYACLRVPSIAGNTRDGHVEIVEAFKTRDAGRLDRAMVEHLSEVKRVVSSYMREQRLPLPMNTGASSGKAFGVSQ